VRRGELIAGVGCIAFGVVFWNQGWWHWLLIGLGVFTVLPWGGARTVLRKADKNPDVLVRDPAQSDGRMGRRHLRGCDGRRLRVGRLLVDPAPHVAV